MQTFLQENLTFNIHVLDTPSVFSEESDAINAARKEYVSAVLENGIDYNKCIFLDGCKLSRTNLQVAKTRAKKQKDTSIRLQNFLCLSAEGVLAFSQDASPTPNMKKLPNLEKQGSAQGTRVDHFRHFVNGVIQILKESQKTNLYFVIEDLPDSKDQKVIDAIKKAKHKILLIPAQSSFFNPSCNFWAQVKMAIKRTPIGINDTLATRIVEAVKTITPKETQNWVDESMGVVRDYLPQQ